MTEPLLQPDLEPPRRFPLVLLGFGALSLFAHAATFFLFQVEYPPNVTIPPAPAQIALLTGDGPEEQALLRWIESEDPALIAASAHPVPASLFETNYRPSYTTSRTPPRSMPIAPEPAVQAPGPDLTALLGPPSAKPLPPPAPSRTSLHFAGPLAGRAPTADSAAQFHARSAAPLESATALLGVNSEGEVRYALLQKSSGDRASDEAALAACARLHFAASESALTWGHILINWGDDAFTPPAAK